MEIGGVFIYPFFAAEWKENKNAEKLNNCQSIYLNIRLQEGRVFRVYIKSLFFKFSWVFKSDCG